MATLHPSIGSILLKRKNRDFEAVFCIMKEDHSRLVQHVDLLHPEERAYYNSLKADVRKASYLLGRLTAKLAVSSLLQISDIASVFIDFGIFQFPVVKNIGNNNIQVSISHRDEISVALAFPEEHPLGIDIEKISPDKIADIKDFITRKEHDLVAKSGLPVHIGYTLLWTMKESMSKILKTGLTITFNLLEVDTLTKTGSTYTGTFVNFTQYKAIASHGAIYVCSVTIPRQTDTNLDIFFESLARTC